MAGALGATNTATSIPTTTDVATLQTMLWPFFTTGLYVSAAVNSLANTTIAGAADRWDAVPFLVTKTLTIDQASIDVTTGVALAECRIGFYNADTTTGLPTTLIQASGGLAATAATVVTWTVSQVFQPFTWYWIAVQHSSTATLRGVNVGGLRNIGAASSGNTNYTIARRTNATYASGMPDPAGFSGSFTSAIMPIVRLRVA